MKGGWFEFFEEPNSNVLRKKNCFKLYTKELFFGGRGAIHCLLNIILFNFKSTKLYASKLLSGNRITKNKILEQDNRNIRSKVANFTKINICQYLLCLRKGSHFPSELIFIPHVQYYIKEFIYLLLRQIGNYFAGGKNN